MNIYLQAILITMAICQYILVITGELTGKQTHRNLRFLCGLVMLLTLLSPVLELKENISTAISNIIQSTETEQIEDTIDVRNEAVMDAVFAYTAEEWFQYIIQQYHVNRSQIRLQFSADEKNNIISAEITLRECPYVLRTKMEKELSEIWDFPVTVKGE